MELKIERPIISKLNIITNSMKTNNNNNKDNNRKYNFKFNVKNNKQKLPSLVISKHTYDEDINYKEYYKLINNKEICIELCKIDNIINDDNYWKYNKEILHMNIFNEVYYYSKTSLISYKNMLITNSRQFIV